MSRHALATVRANRAATARRPCPPPRFRDALRGKRIPHAYRAYEGESHGFRKAETIIDALNAELRFYGRILGFEPRY